MVEMMMMVMISEDCGRLCFSSQDATEFVSLHQKCHLLTFDPSFSIYYFAFCTFSPVLFTKKAFIIIIFCFFSVYKKLYFRYNICQGYRYEEIYIRKFWEIGFGVTFPLHTPTIYHSTPIKVWVHFHKDVPLIPFVPFVIHFKLNEKIADNKFLLTFRPGFLFCGITQDTLTWENSESKSFQSCRIQSQSRLITCLEIVYSNKDGPDDDDNHACKMMVMMIIIMIA